MAYTDIMPVDQNTIQPSSDNLLIAVDVNWHRDSQLNNVQRARDFGELHPKLNVFIRTLPSKLRDLCGKGGGKMMLSSLDCLRGLNTLLPNKPHTEA